MDIADNSPNTIAEILGSEPTINELRVSRYRTEVTFRLPYDSYIVGDLYHPFPSIPDEPIAFHVSDFEVNENMRRNGIGKKLLKKATLYAKEHDAKYLYGMVQNAEALRTRASVFGKDNMRYYSSFLYGRKNEPFLTTFEEVIEKGYFPIYVLSDLSTVEIT